MLQTINPYSVVPFLTSFLSLSLGVLVCLKWKLSREHQLFSWLCFALFLWPFSLSVFLNLTDPRQILEWAKYGHVTCTLAPALYVDFTITYLKKENMRWASNVYYVIAALTLLTLLTTDLYFPGDLMSYPWGFYAAPGPLVYLDFALGTMACLLCYREFIIAWRTQRTVLSANEYNKLRYIIIALTAFSFAMFDYLPKFNLPVPPIGSYFIGIFGVTTAYAMIKHQILDIEIVLRRTAIYSVLVALLTAIYLGLVLLGEKLFQGFFGYDSIVMSLVVGVAIALGFTPLRDFVQRYMDRFFFKGTQAALAEENEMLRQELVRSEKLKAVSTFAAGMAHEIKNPLAAIKTFAEFLPEKYDDPQFRTKFSRIMNDEVNRMNGIVHRLLEFSKPGRPDLEQVQISKILNETIEFLQGRFIERKVQIKTQVMGDDWVNADKQQMKQVFLNILLNSIDSINDGGKIEVRLSDHGQELSISIADSGSGIPRQEVNHVFDPFYTTKSNGTGLGLSVVESIMRNHKGRVLISSTTGQGTTVELILPKAIQLEMAMTEEGVVHGTKNLNR